MVDQVTLESIFAPSDALAWRALESAVMPSPLPCVPTDDALLHELRALRADVAALVLVIGTIADCWARQLNVQERNAVPPELWRQLDAIVRRRRARGA